MPTNFHKQGTPTSRLLDQLNRSKHLLASHWWILLGAVVACVGIQALILWFKPPTYLSFGRMIVNVKLSLPNSNIYDEQSDLNNFYGTQVALMQSDSVIDRVDRSLQGTNPVAYSQPISIDVTMTPKSSIFNLRAVGANPEFTRAYLQATMDEYINLKKDLLAHTTTAAQSSMEEQLQKIAIELQKSKDDVENYQSSNQVVFIQPNGNNNAADYLDYLNRNLVELRMKLVLKKNSTADQDLEKRPSFSGMQLPGSLSNSVPPNNYYLSSPPSSLSSLFAPADLGDFENDYFNINKLLTISEAQRDAFLGENLSASSPKMVQVNSDISFYKNILSIDKRQNEERLKTQQHTLELEIQDLESEIKGWEVKALDVNQKLANLTVLKENEKRLQLMYDQMQADLHALDVSKGIEQESVTILEPASTAIFVSPRPMRHIAIAIFIGLLAGFGILMLMSHLDDRPTSFTEVEALFDQPILGQFPLLKTAHKVESIPILQPDDERHALVEAFQNLRSAFIYKDTPENHPRTIVVTSASPNDGKSMISSNFAITLAQSGARVLLVDADLRRGTLHKYFSLPLGPGLAEVLAQKCDWSHAVVPTSIPNLSLLPCGAYPQHPGRLFAMQTGKFLDDIAGKYDYYLFDTAPVMAADDVSNLAPHVDGLILVIRAGYTSGRAARAALDLLNLRRVNVIGLVFNAVQSNVGKYAYYGYKDYYPNQPTA